MIVVTTFILQLMPHVDSVLQCWTNVNKVIKGTIKQPNIGERTTPVYCSWIRCQFHRFFIGGQCSGSTLSTVIFHCCNNKRDCLFVTSSDSNRSRCHIYFVLSSLTILVSPLNTSTLGHGHHMSLLSPYFCYVSPVIILPPVIALFSFVCSYR